MLRQWQQTDLKPSSLPGVIAMSSSLIVVAVAMPVTSRCPTLRSVKFISSCRHIITHRLSMIDVIRDFSRSVTHSRRYRVFPFKRDRDTGQRARRPIPFQKLFGRVAAPMKVVAESARKVAPPHLHNNKTLTIGRRKNDHNESVENPRGANRPSRAALTFHFQSSCE